jgi:V8-like Glu-specific endopeptidase
MTRHVLIVGVALVTAVLFATATQVTKAQNTAGAHLRLETAQTANATAAYWTPERLASARPRTMVANSLAEAPFDAQSSRPVLGSAGRPPAPGIIPDLRNVLYHPSLVADAPADDQVTPSNAGTLNAHFTSSRVIPYGAIGGYPFSTAGKLFFSDGVSDFTCSASVIAYRVVVTAGHCVHEGSGGAGGFFQNWMFVPAHVVGMAPFGTWGVEFVVVTDTWATGGGGVPNAADYAMFEMQDRVASPTRIGSVVGFLGWQIGSLNPNHVTMLGYPFNFDSAELMHRVDAGAFRNTVPNNVEYGSDQTGGSSGGPWIQNFGEPSIGQTGGINPGLNRVVGVTSYGFISPNPKVQGASVPDQRWVDLFNTVCAHRVGNCTP